ncbi:hypothetical protein SGFS_066670 [Streptomyces graminofaciens]|uniref:Phytanoyl-CoA dioxygenase n=1 Tax=Streptomyces graminofaciens TaxID=68212 RepID=A0ABM8HLQ9_9ACTN|nr:hypothetical protein [Streptomyces graminofaciens]BBC35373.1 hypothetical protein SGFS_066670 [Streptomyces graminofaciens]
MRGTLVNPVIADRNLRWTVCDWDYSGLDEDLVWQAGLAAGAAQTSGRFTDALKLLVDGEFVKDPKAWPGGLGSPETPWEWLDRAVRSTEGGADAVLYYARGLQEYHRGLFEALLGGLAPLLTRIGLPCGYIESELFLGRYAATPGGIHREGCTNLHMVLQGKKVMHLWDSNDWIPAGTDIRADVDPLGNVEEEYLPDLRFSEVEHLTTTTLRPGPGQAMFWRSGIWHVGDTPEPSLSVNVAMYTGSFDNPRPWIDVPVGADGQLPAEWLAEYRDFARIADSDEEALALASSIGMRGIATRNPLPDAAPAAVRRRTPAPLLWVRSGEDALVATHGAVERFPAATADWVAELAARGTDEELAVTPATRDLARWLERHSLVDGS